MGLRELLFGRKPEPEVIEDDDFATDIYPLTLVEILSRLEGTEDDDANIELELEELE